MRRRVRTASLVIGVLLVGAGLWLAVSRPKTLESMSAAHAQTRQFSVGQSQKAAPIKQALHPDVPNVIRIPSLGIRAVVQPAGLNRAGEMEAPVTREGVGWYKYGYLPGTPGNAVMAGHSDYKGTPGIFAGLNALVTGDVIEIVSATHVTTFSVYDKQIYHPDDAAREALFGPGAEARLHLITCDGAWDAAAKRYAERLVVSARFIKETPLEPAQAL